MRKRDVVKEVLLLLVFHILLPTGDMFTDLITSLYYRMRTTRPTTLLPRLQPAARVAHLLRFRLDQPHNRKLPPHLAHLASEAFSQQNYRASRKYRGFTQSSVFIPAGGAGGGAVPPVLRRPAAPDLLPGPGPGRQGEDETCAQCEFRIFLYHALHRLSQVSAGSPLLESCVEAVPR